MRSARWTQKPPVGCEIDWGHPITRNLGGCYLLNSLYPKNLVFRDTTVAVSGSPSRSLGSSQFGEGIKFDGSSKIRVTCPSNFCAQSKSTIVTGFRFNTKDTYALTLFGGVSIRYLTDNDRLKLAWYYWGGGWQGMDIIWTDRRYKDYCGMFRYPSATNTFEWRIGLRGDNQGDGVATQSTGESMPTWQNSYIDFGGDAAGNASLDGNLYYCYVWKRLLTLTEYQELKYHPYCFLRPIPRRFYSVAGGTNVTVEPDTLSIAASVQVPTIDTVQNVTITPDVLSLVTSVQDPTVTTGTNVTIEPDALSVVSSAPAPTVSTIQNVSIAPDAQTVAATVADPTVSAIQNVTIEPSVLSITAGVQAPEISLGATIAPSALDVVASLQDPTVLAGGDVAISAEVLSAQASVQSPDIALSCTISVSVLSVPASAQTPSLSADAILAPDTFVIVAGLQSPTINGAVNFAPAVLSLQAGVQTVTLSLGAGVEVSAFVIGSDLVAAVISGGVVQSVAVQSITAGVQTPSIVLIRLDRQLRADSKHANISADSKHANISADSKHANISADSNL